MSSTKTIAHPAHDLEHTSSITARVLRGLQLHEERGDEIEHTAPHVYVVPGCSGGSYVVHLARQTCECPDHQRHPELTCKHLAAATIAAAKSRRRRSA